MTSPVPNNDLVKFKANDERSKQAQRNGGLKSADVRRRKRQMRELANIILQMPMKSGELSDIANIEEMQKAIADETGKGLNLTVQEMALFSAAAKGAAGDIEAMRFVRDTAGQKPIERIEETDTEKASAEIDAMIQGLGTVSLGHVESEATASPSTDTP